MLAILALWLVTGCASTAKLASPTTPMLVNTNVRIDPEVRTRVEQDLDALMHDEKDIF